jgi:hypothetical protein
MKKENVYPVVTSDSQTFVSPTSSRAVLSWKCLRSVNGGAEDEPSLREGGETSRSSQREVLSERRLVTRAGLEPATTGLKVRCSTTELPGHARPNHQFYCAMPNPD